MVSGGAHDQDSILDGTTRPHLSSSSSTAACTRLGEKSRRWSNPRTKARNASLRELLTECAALDAFRRHSDNLYERVRALLFLASFVWLVLCVGAVAVVPFTVS